MTKQLDSNFFSKLMTGANMGWWKADLETESYTCSEHIAQLLGLKEDGIITFKDFNKRILKEEQQHTTIRSFDNIKQMPETVYLLDTPGGAVWFHSKISFQETDNSGKTIIYGIAETQDGPSMTSAYQALQQNERILYNIYKHLPVGIELYSKDGTLIDLNDKELEIFHIARKEDLLGINIFENPIFPEEMKEKLRKHENADFTFRYDFSKVGKYYRTQKKKGTIDLVTKITTLYDDQHEPINYLLINADKTETTVAYNKIQEFESFFELVGDYARVGYANYNIATGQGHAQKSWYKNLGEKDDTSLSEIIGVYSHVHPKDRNKLVEFVKKAKEGCDKKLSKEVRVLREDGTYTWTHINLLVRQYAPQDNIIELICINYDITDLKKTEEMLIKAKDKAEESDRLKSAFLANMSHEIRTPLNAIVGFSNLLSYTDDPGEKEQYNSLISYNNELLLNLINDVLDLSKIESGHIKLQPDWFNLTDLIKQCCIEHERNTPTEVQLLTQCPRQEYLVELDHTRIKQLLNNFISNALKNTTRGHICISYKTTRQGVKISVTDTGRGIPRDKTEKIFERFEKLDSFAQGVGLGLSICKSIVEKMNGRIGVKSKVGIGSTLWVELPCPLALVKE